MPMDSAVYVASQDKVYGMMGPYVVQCDAATGEAESRQRVVTMAKGPCHICYHAATSKLYVTTWNAQVGMHWDTPTGPERDIFPVDPTTLVVGTRLGIYDLIATWWSDDPYYFQGPRFILSQGSLLWFLWHDGGSNYLCRVDPTNPAAFIASHFSNPRDTGSNFGFFVNQQFSTDGTTIFQAWPYGPDVLAATPIASPTVAISGYCELSVADTGIIMPVSAEYCAGDGKVWVACGSQYLLRANSWAGAEDYTTYNLDLITAGCTPFRLRYCNTAANPYFGKLLLPSQGNDTIIVFDPLTGNGIAKTGFDGPIDVVFTGTKAFAVQSGLVGLKEIT